MEAETQFDLDDILCSNYTQTTSADDGKIISDNLWETVELFFAFNKDNISIT